MSHALGLATPYIMVRGHFRAQNLGQGSPPPPLQNWLAGSNVIHLLMYSALQPDMLPV